MALEQRGPERFGLGLPLTVDGELAGTIRDLSATGISFHAAKAYMAGTVVELAVEHPSPSGDTILLRAQATVVRWEQSGDGYTMGAQLAAPFME
jgi:hypothetical protein